MSKITIDVWICSSCGNIFINTAPSKCVLCGAPKEFFKKLK
ncbi:MAG: rubredoxin-like domain-containing protein [Candidatus Odinarchaeia archaeon]